MNDEMPSYAELENLTDRQVLYIILERMRTFGTNQTNHLKHHWAITLICVTIGLTGVLNVLIALMIIFSTITGKV